MGRQIALINSEHSHLWSCAERGISLFVCLVAGNKLVEIAGAQPCRAVVSLAALFAFSAPQNVGIKVTLFTAKRVIIESLTKKKNIL